jgi:ectoine hydroxylase-related dioxygenase (phytanoyl-CoA dioxygenase family)
MTVSESEIHCSDDLCPEETEKGNEQELPKGSVVLFSSKVWHRSGINLEREPRRVFYAQYSPQPISVPVEGTTDNKNSDCKNNSGREEVLSFAIPC